MYSSTILVYNMMLHQNKGTAFLVLFYVVSIYWQWVRRMRNSLQGCCIVLHGISFDQV